MSSSPIPSPAPSPAPSSASSTMPPPPRPSTDHPVTTTVFAPKPVRLPPAYLSLLPQRTPSPRASRTRSATAGSEDAGAGGGVGEQMVRLYSPGPTNENVLDDFLKLVRATHNRTPGAVSPRPQQQPGHRKQLSSGSEGGEKMVIPASPVSRTLTRNPIIYNSQFGLVQEES